MNARGGRRDTPGKVLKDRRSPRGRGRMGTSVQNAPHRRVAADESRAAGHEDVPGERAAVGGGERERAAVTAASAGGAGGRGAAAEEEVDAQREAQRERRDAVDLRRSGGGGGGRRADAMRRRTMDGRRDGRTEDDAREERSDGRGREEARTGSRMTRDAMDSYARRAPFVGERGMVVMTRALSSEYETGYKKRDVSFPPASLFLRAALRRGPPRAVARVLKPRLRGHRRVRYPQTVVVVVLHRRSLRAPRRVHSLPTQRVERRAEGRGSI